MKNEYQYPKPDTSAWGKFRDNTAYGIATFALKHIATPWYGAMIAGSIRLCLQSARDEAHRERTIPTSELIPDKEPT